MRHKKIPRIEVVDVADYCMEWVLKKLTQKKLLKHEKTPEEHLAHVLCLKIGAEEIRRGLKRWNAWGSESITNKIKRPRSSPHRA